MVQRHEPLTPGQEQELCKGRASSATNLMRSPALEGRLWPGKSIEWWDQSTCFCFFTNPINLSGEVKLVGSDRLPFLPLFFSWAVAQKLAVYCVCQRCSPDKGYEVWEFSFAHLLPSSPPVEFLMVKAPQLPSSRAPQSQKKLPCLLYVTSWSRWHTLAHIEQHPTPSTIPELAW